MAGAGVLLGHYTNIHPRSLSQLILYIFSPCLIFSLLTTNKVSNDQFIKVVLFSFVLLSIIGGITWLTGYLLKIERSTQSSMTLTAMFPNAGNFGLPVVLFAFGEPSMGFASLFFVTSISITYTIGTVIASMGSMSFTKALANLFKLPLIYAVLLAVLFINTGWNIPLPLERATKLLGDASIPCMLVLLGLQLKAARIKDRILPIGVVSSVRLVLSPLLALILIPFFGLHGVASQAIVLQAGMPSAVMTSMLATEFDSDPSFASAAVFLTTIISPFTLTPLLSLLGA
jgi:malate permease and related proteins